MNNAKDINRLFQLSESILKEGGTDSLPSYNLKKEFHKNGKIKEKGFAGKNGWEGEHKSFSETGELSNHTFHKDGVPYNIEHARAKFPEGPWLSSIAKKANESKEIVESKLEESTVEVLKRIIESEDSKQTAIEELNKIEKI